MPGVPLDSQCKAQRLSETPMTRFYSFKDMVEPSKQGARLVPVSKATLYRMIAEGQFPRPRKLGSRSLWSEDDIQSWHERFLDATNG